MTRLLWPKRCLQMLVFLSLLGMMALGGCASNDSDDTAGIRIPNPQTDEEEEEQVALTGVFSIAQSSENQQSRQGRLINGVTVRLLDINGDLIDTTTTGRQGNFEFTVLNTEDNLPWTLKARLGETTYSSAIASLASSNIVNINDITTQITEIFSTKQDQSVDNFNRVALLVMANQFGVNQESNLNIPPEVFLTEEMSDPHSLGNLLLEAAAEANVRLIEAAPEDESWLANSRFLNAFSTKFRDADNPEESLGPIRGRPGSDSFVNELIKVANAANQDEIDASLGQIRNNTLQNSGKKKDHIKELEEAIENAEKHHKPMKP